MTQEQLSFVQAIYSALQKYAPAYNIKSYPAIIAQAINESGWGTTILATKCHNYFGMKCGSNWTGKSFNKDTKEEYTYGQITTVNANFRMYDSLEEGVKGYLDFINTTRYANLKGVIDPYTYIVNVKNDGYATSSSYITSLMSLVDKYELNKYCYVAPKPPVTVEQPHENACSFTVGNNYTLQDNMIVRSGAGRNFAPVGHNGLTTDGKKHDTDKNGSLDKGTVITCKDVVVENGNVWVKAPSGWVAGYYNGVVYIK